MADRQEPSEKLAKIVRDVCHRYGCKDDDPVFAILTAQNELWGELESRFKRQILRMLAIGAAGIFTAGVSIAIFMVRSDLIWVPRGIKIRKMDSGFVVLSERPIRAFTKDGVLHVVEQAK